jgi:hypothetical protein
MPSLKDIARQISGLAVAKAPKRTGNLKKQLQRANTPSQVLKESKGGFSFEINYAPPGAEYGMFWNDPTVSKTVSGGKTKNIPQSINFADKALNSPIVDSLLQDYIEEISAQVAKQVKSAIDDLDT